MDSSGTVTLLHSFSANANPDASLIQASDGFFYGTTVTGGSHGQGSVFKIDSSGAFTNVHSFNVTDGSGPFGSVVEGTDGNFYGTTCCGGANGDGVVFKMRPSGTVTTLHSFGAGRGLRWLASSKRATGSSTARPSLEAPTEWARSSRSARRAHSPNFIPSTAMTAPLPSANLLQASDGNFYGTAGEGSLVGGEIFEIDSAGNFNVLVNLGNRSLRRASDPARRRVPLRNDSRRGIARKGVDLQGESLQRRFHPALLLLRARRFLSGSRPRAGDRRQALRHNGRRNLLDLPCGGECRRRTGIGSVGVRRGFFEQRNGAAAD